MTGFPLEPNLRELLGAIVRDSEATLLNVPRGAVGLGTGGGSARAGTSAPFLRRAERRLLEVYRDEVARLLYRLAIVQRDARRPSTTHFADRAMPLPARGGLELRARKLVRFWARDLDDLPAVDLLRACVGGRRHMSPAQLTAAALRLAPSARVRIAHAADLASFEGLRRQAERLLHGVLAEQATGELASYALENLALVRAWNHRAVARLQERAVLADRARIVPSLAWLWHSARDLAGGGSTERVRRAAEQVDRTVGPEHPALAWYLRTLAAPDARSLPGPVREEVERAGPVSRSVLLRAGSGPVRAVCGAPALSDAGPARGVR